MTKIDAFSIAMTLFLIIPPLCVFGFWASEGFSTDVPLFNATKRQQLLEHIGSQLKEQQVQYQEFENRIGNFNLILPILSLTVALVTFLLSMILRCKPEEQNIENEVG